jgi:hypothetical protein
MRLEAVVEEEKKERLPYLTNKRRKFNLRNDDNFETSIFRSVET